ncbi:lipopolysaccharide biosynthesis protein [Zoogloea sp.]|uniref:lipopolysaccharide biosynthesis protein n=1 Tax=Zoogloea sp. TaxID=49181 RepID=UPI0035ADA3EC
MSTRKALAFSFLDRYASHAIGMVSSMIIARLLTPGELGVFSVTMVLLAFLSTVRDLGAGEYLVQEKELTTARVRAVWAVQLGLGLGLALIILLAAVPVSAFYGEPKMRDIMFVIALNYAINPFGSLTYAYLIREMRFDSIALIRFSGTMTGTVVSLTLAWQGYGPISLALGMFATTLVSALTSIYFRPKSFPWIPGTSEIRRVLSFGGKLTSTSLLNTLSSNAPELLLGKMQNMAAVGFYSRASGLVAIFNRLITDPIITVAMSGFARQRREHGQFTEAFLKANAYICALGWSFCLVLILLAHPITHVLYGTQWDDSVDLARILAIGNMFVAPVTLGAAALTASGQAGRMLMITGITSVTTIVLAVGGAALGVTLLAWSMTLTAAVSAAVWIHMLKAVVGFSWSQLFDALWRSALIALASAIGPLIVVAEFGLAPENSLLAVGLGGTGASIGFIGAAILTGHPLREELSSAWTKLRARVKPG